MTERYNQAAERLWEKIEFHRGEYDMKCLEPREFSPWDKFCERNPSAKDLARQVDKELNYELSETQCSWAVIMAFNNFPMEDYNNRHGTSLKSRL